MLVIGEKNNPYCDQACKDLRACFKEFYELQERGVALLPVELWINLNTTQDCMHRIVSESETKNGVSEERLKLLIAALTKSALISRSITGPDELTQKAIGLFSSNKDFKKLSELDTAVYEHLVEKNA